jgi:hypothetical protein
MYDFLVPSSDDRRLTPRFPVHASLNEYVKDRVYRALALDVSEKGLAIRTRSGSLIPHSGVVGVEVVLPGTSEIIWASAEPRFHAVGPSSHSSGLHFVAMARAHERLLRDYVRERRARWQRLFAPRPVYASRFGCLFS